MGLRVFVKNAAATTTASIPQVGAISGTSCQIGGNAVLTTTYNPFFCCGKINANGTKAYSSGRVDFTVSRIGAGNFHATYTAAYPNSSYAIATTAIGNTADAGVGANHDTTEAHVYTWLTSTGVLFGNALFSLYFNCSTKVYICGMPK